MDVLVHEGSIDESCAVEMTKALLAALSGHTSARKGTVLTGRELSEKPLLDLVHKFGADGMLVLKPIGGTLTFYEGVAEVIYAAELVELRSDRVVWQATVTHNGGTAAVGKRSRIAAEKIVQSMVLAHVLRKAGS